MTTPTLKRSNSDNGGCGRLIVLDSKLTTFEPFQGLSNYTLINLPSMPDDIDLARTVEYFVSNNTVMPDGIHQYKHTNPLTIPLSFNLHSLDKEYCPQGALSVLQLTALLHSLQLPILKDGTSQLVHYSSQQVNPAETPSGTASAQQNRAVTSTTTYGVQTASSGDYYPPATLRLELIFVDGNGPGIACNGYIKDVRVKLRGPFMRGPRSSTNLPMSADFAFVFVHVPGYGNSFSLVNSKTNDGTIPQAFAGDVKDRLYNTAALSKQTDRSYKGY